MKIIPIINENTLNKNIKNDCDYNANRRREIILNIVDRYDNANSINYNEYECLKDEYTLKQLLTDIFDSNKIKYTQTIDPIYKLIINYKRTDDEFYLHDLMSCYLNVHYIQMVILKNKKIIHCYYQQIYVSILKSIVIKQIQNKLSGVSTPGSSNYFGQEDDFIRLSEDKNDNITKSNMQHIC